MNILCQENYFSRHFYNLSSVKFSFIPSAWKRRLQGDLYVGSPQIETDNRMLILIQRVYIIDPRPRTSKAPAVQTMFGDIFQHLIWFWFQIEPHLVNTSSAPTVLNCLENTKDNYSSSSAGKITKNCANLNLIKGPGAKFLKYFCFLCGGRLQNVACRIFIKQK